MQLIADFLLAAGALSAGIYCLILSRRLASFSKLESGMGGAIAVLSVQVDEMTRALERARGAAGESAAALEGRTRRAEEVAERLDLILASMHDLPEPGGPRRRLRRQPRNRSEEELDA
ncbi:DUF6468 domain-containing protein [Frigidibacter sp. MR17.14]|uniref:DUF6468 domain-containing protein n=1 Tax=Frigidibacter sp. MR17.14 TaxID=3126509 RepID=UPI003012C311